MKSLQLDIIRRKYPDFVLIFLESRSHNITLTQSKFIIPCDMSFGYFLHMLRRDQRIIIQSNQSIIGVIVTSDEGRRREVLPNISQTMGYLDRCYRRNVTDIIHDVEPDEDTDDIVTEDGETHEGTLRKEGLLHIVIMTESSWG